MLKLAVFADEISPDLNVQIEHCRKNGVLHVELRGVAGKNVLDFDPALRAEIKRKLADNGLTVIGIGSPIGKVKLNDPFDAHFEKFKVAVELTEFFNAPFLRIFSYYPAEGSTHDELVRKGRDEVIRRMQRKVDYVKGRKLVLLHENEAAIFGEKARQCLDLHQSVPSPQFRAAFDFANFLQAMEDPLECWRLLKPYTIHFHIKDVALATGAIVPAGQGDGHIGEILKDAYASGYRGFLSIEPHLAAHGQFSGFTGPALFKTAVDAVRKVASDNAIPLAP
jgi:sugar phosphate isomerase/epimerase